MLLALAILAPPAAAQLLAIVEDRIPVSTLAPLLHSSWTLRSASNASASDVAAAEAFVEAPPELLANAANGKLYQYAFTGIPDSYIAKIPPRFTVANTHQSSIPIAEYVLSAILDHTVRLRAMDAALRQCTWHTSAASSCGDSGMSARIKHGQVSNLTLGILGYGHIGEAIAQRAAAFGMRLIATTLDPPAKPPSPLAWLKDDSANPQLFSESDFLVVCLPLMPSTTGLVGSSLLSKMKSTGVLINIARGPIVDEAALFDALSSKVIGGAVLDVWWHSIFEMVNGTAGPAGWPASHRFDQLDNVVMSAHDSGDTAGSLDEAIKEVAANLDNLAAGKPLNNVLRNGTLAARVAA